MAKEHQNDTFLMNSQPDHNISLDWPCFPSLTIQCGRSHSPSGHGTFISGRSSCIAFWQYKRSGKVIQKMRELIRLVLNEYRADIIAHSIGIMPTSFQSPQHVHPVILHRFGRNKMMSNRYIIDYPCLARSKEKRKSQYFLWFRYKQ